VRLIREGPIVGRSTGTRGKQTTTEQSRELVIHLDGFALDAIAEESDRLGVPIEEIARFSVLYYLADLDSGRVARRIPMTSRAFGETPD
jgi:hypothetical protein